MSSQTQLGPSVQTVAVSLSSVFGQGGPESSALATAKNVMTNMAAQGGGGGGPGFGAAIGALLSGDVKGAVGAAASAAANSGVAAQLAVNPQTSDLHFLASSEAFSWHFVGIFAEIWPKYAGRPRLGTSRRLRMCLGMRLCSSTTGEGTAAMAVGRKTLKFAHM